jgi:RNA polymerase sigma factor (sigma-70 family)
MKKPDNNDYNAIWDLFIAEGNQEALGMIYFSHYDLLYNFGLKYTSDKQIIEDAIQDIFSYFLRIGSKMPPVKNLRAFLLQSFRNRLLFDLKRRNRLNTRDQFKEKSIPGHEPEVHKVFEQEWCNNLGKTIAKCMELLSKKQKEAIFLRFQSELSYDEIAVILGITVDSCYKLVYRSLKELRIEFERLEEGSKQMMNILLGKD